MVINLLQTVPQLFQLHRTADLGLLALKFIPCCGAVFYTTNSVHI